MTPDRLAEIERRRLAATGGKWETHANAGYCGIMAGGRPIFLADGATFADGSFIAHCGGDDGDVAWLVAEVKRLRDENDALSRLNADNETLRDTNARTALDEQHRAEKAESECSALRQRAIDIICRHVGPPLSTQMIQELCSSSAAAKEAGDD